jgi:hypothetical protein
MRKRTWHPERLVLVVDMSEDAVAGVAMAAGCRCAVEEILCTKVPGVEWRGVLLVLSIPCRRSPLCVNPVVPVPRANHVGGHQL